MTRRPDTLRSLPRPAQRYVVGVCAAAVAVVVLLSAFVAQPAPDWGLLALLAALCVVGNLSEILAPGHYSLQPSYAALVWGCLLEPAWAAPVLAVACFAPEIVHRESGTA